jgi:DNA helicase-2/ATP-dependent DNA helicase PcrA
MYGGVSFYQRAEIKDALAYMRLAVNPLDDESLNRIINYPARGIGNNTMDKLLAYAFENNISLWETINRLSSTRLLVVQMKLKDSTVKKITDFKELIETFISKVNTENACTFATNIIKQSGMMTELKDSKSPEGVSRIENIEELLNGIKEYTKIAENKENGTMIAEYLQNVSLITDMDKDSSKDTNRVTLMTVHSAKGLEYGYVYIVGMEEGLFPGTNAVQTEHTLEEERRLFYVALTRAAVKATVSFAQTRYRWGNLSSSVPSRFLRDIDIDCLSANSIKDFLYKENPFQANVSYDNPAKKTFSDYKLEQKKTYLPVETFDISAIPPGTEVEHARFGRGHIVEIEIEGNDARAKIEFYTVGLKTLILKYTKLNVVREPD